MTITPSPTSKKASRGNITAIYTKFWLISSILMLFLVLLTELWKLKDADLQGQRIKSGTDSQRATYRPISSK